MAFTSTPFLVGAIDFGTTYSGWAFSFAHDYKSDPEKISLKHWSTGTGSLVTEKVPTVALFRPNGHTLEAFGYEAEDKFQELVENRKHQGYYYFRRFKMKLNKPMEEKISRSFTIEDEFGRQLSAMTVFSNSIKFLTDDMMKQVKTQLRDAFSKCDVTWVLTVPAIWTDSAKQFMREAAIEAGIDTDKLKIALEPEAASIYCRLRPAGGKQAQFSPGTEYMVLDAGGGTIDITVHKIQRNRRLKEVHAANGGGWGGVLVDDAFKALLIDLIGKRVYERFKKEETDDWLGLWRDFEMKKRQIKPETNGKINMRFPLSLSTLFEKLERRTLSEAIESSKYSNDILFVGDKIKFEASILKRLFRGPIQKIVQHVERIKKHRKVRDIEAILMVGGFSDSPMLQTAVKEEFQDLDVIVPPDAVSAIMKGAVIFGHTPAVITERVLKYTYGVSGSEKFVEGEHPNYRKYYTKDRGNLCYDIFFKHVEKSQTVKVGERLERQRYSPMKKDDQVVSLPIFASELRDPKYTDEECTRIGEINIDLPNHDGDLERGVYVSFTFGGTEIEVTGEDERTGRQTNVTVDYLG